MPAVIAAADTRLRGLRQHVPDAGGMIIASDQTAARAYADLLSHDHRRSADRGAVGRQGLLRPHLAVLGGHVAVAGRRAHGVRGCRRAAARGRGLRHQRVDAAVLRPGDRPVRAVATARRDAPASSCRRCPTCCCWPARWRPSATTSSASRTGRPWRTPSTPSCAEQKRDEPDDEENGIEYLGADAELDQVIFDGSSFGTATPAGSEEEADYLGIPGPAGHHTDARPVAAQAGRATHQTHCQRRGATAVHARPVARAAHASSTRWCRWPITAPGSRTGGSTTSCGGSAAARRIAAATTDQLKARIEAVRGLKV